MLAAAALLGGTPALADNDDCKIEDWRHWSPPSGQLFWVEGTTTCRTGWITIRVYDGQEAFVGTTSAQIRGYAFNASVPAAPPDKAGIRYVIEQR